MKIWATSSPLSLCSEKAYGAGEPGEQVPICYATASEHRVMGSLRRGGETLDSSALGTCLEGRRAGCQGSSSLERKRENRTIPSEVRALQMEGVWDSQEASVRLTRRRQNRTAFSLLQWTGTGLLPGESKTVQPR